MALVSKPQTRTLNPMENRRQTYRQLFEPKEALRAELHRSEEDPVLACEVLDLSLGGMRVRLRKLVGPLSVGDTLVTRLIGRGTPAPVNLNLSVQSKVVFLTQDGKEWHCGLRFLTSADVRVNDLVEQTLSRFLLAEQRRRKEAANRRS
jgi:c-di-GMP-binding flagellar brake protein YcgR